MKPVIEVSNLGIKFSAQKRTASRLINYVPRMFHRNGGSPDVPKEFWALHKVNFTINQGERVGIIGVNGSGKSTLLRAIAGIYSPDVGKVQLHTPVSTIMGLSLGFQRDLNAIDNTKLSCAIMGMAPRTIEQVLPDIISFADLDPPSKVYESVHTYSSGMQARLAFSLALHTDAPTILIDEILGAGDLAFHAKCQTALRKLLTDKTLLLVSHSPEQIQSFCDRTLWLHQGWLHMDGPTPEVLTAYQEFVVKEATCT